jgi:hypothetical protein
MELLDNIYIFLQGIKQEKHVCKTTLHLFEFSSYSNTFTKTTLGFFYNYKNTPFCFLTYTFKFSKASRKHTQALHKQTHTSY